MTKLTPIEQLREVVKLSTADGNWNYDHYMHGMANGLILALAIIEDKVPEFLEAPEHWKSSNFGVRFPRRKDE